ncbi:hypothetical protein [Nonomuraea cavernae]|uniref:Uncharacterized protein n=1 Tax=Nonomuraea cavernae TaxID=2045107 RepID=A0A918DFS2_9ACTN|nr:hypothetical protein [Nonomuraea cavernae]MCA2184252.1 hypothetical protein [Nonomuraea cavernae]GGO64373.1 hypothetical protein GCM10012289_13640 [Nonomuraea cavernae]
MPNKHKYAAVVFRPDPDLHRRAREAVATVGSNMNAHVIGFLHWVVGDTDELPPRPTDAHPQSSAPDEANSAAK